MEDWSRPKGPSDLKNAETENAAFWFGWSIRFLFKTEHRSRVKTVLTAAARTYSLQAAALGLEPQGFPNEPKHQKWSTSGTQAGVANRLMIY
jgi:hypothetical protein